MSARTLKSFSELSPFIRQSSFGTGLSNYPTLNTKPKAPRKGGLYDVSFTGSFGKVVDTGKAYVLFKGRDDLRPFAVMPRFDGIRVTDYQSTIPGKKQARIMIHARVKMPVGLAVAKGLV